MCSPFIFQRKRKLKKEDVETVANFLLKILIKKSQELNVMKFRKSECCGKLILQTARKEEKSAQRYS